MEHQVIHQPPSEALTLLAVEQFIRHVLFIGLFPQQLTDLKYLLEQYDRIYNIDCYYCDYQRVFLRLRVLLDEIRDGALLYRGLDQEIDHSYNFVLSLTQDQLQFLQQQINLYNSQVHTDFQQFSQQEKENAKSLTAYLTKLFQHYARLLVVRVDLKYSKEVQQDMTIEQFYRHFEKMRNRLSNQDTCFEHLQGYAWAMEQGWQEGGYHVHLLLIYNADKHRSGSALAQQVGEKWRDLTDQKGAYYNLHNKDYLNKLRMQGHEIGLGTLSRNEEGDFNKLLTVALYLTKETKESQRLRVKTSKGMQTFGHGSFERDSRRGIK